MNTPEVLSGLVSELICRGLPVEYAERAAAELGDHHRDLVEELQATGFSESQAITEASHRLGDPRKLLTKTVLEYQKRFWCARWPLTTFLIAPIPALIMAWFAIINLAWWIVVVATKLGLTGTSEAGVAFTDMPLTIKFGVLAATFLLAPTVVMYIVARLGKRAAVSGKWFVVAACVLGMFSGVFRWNSIDPYPQPILRNSRTGEVIPQPKHDFTISVWVPTSAHEFSWPVLKRAFFSNPIQPCQLLLPLVIAAAFLYRRQQALPAEDRLKYC